MLIILMIMPVGCGSTQSPAAEEVSFRTDAIYLAAGTATARTWSIVTTSGRKWW